MKFGLFKSLRLKKRIISVSRYGLCVKGQYLNIKYLYNTQPEHLAAFSIKKKIAKAHERNLLKRRIRAILSKTTPLAQTSLLIFAKLGVMEASFKELKEELFRLLLKIDRSKNGAS